MSTSQVFRISALIFSTGAFAFFARLWWQRANMTHNEAGRYFDGVVVWQEQSVLVYAFLSILSLFVWIVTSYLVWKK